jgi:hypothetical protein
MKAVFAEDVEGELTGADVVKSEARVEQPDEGPDRA